MIAPLLLAAAVAAPSGLDLTSDALVLEPGAREATATGHVHARSAELDVTCDEARAAYGDGEGGRREIVRLELKGAVHATRRLDGLVADAGQATWDRLEGRLVLAQEPVVKRGADVLRGARFVLQLASDALEVDQPQVTLLRRPREPTRVTAARLSVTGAGSQAVFERGVQLRQGAFVGASDRLEAALDGGPTRDRRLSRLALSGNVRLERDDLRATARTADYDAATGDLVLEGDPTLDSQADRLEGERIVFNGETGRAHVEKATARVRGSR